MRSQNQITIYSLNDVVTGTVAPTKPYKGQLWVDTSKSPPITKVWDGSAWKEQNGTDILGSDIKTLQTRASNLETNLNGLTSTVSDLTQTVTEDGKVIETLSSNVTILQQTATSIESRVSTNETNISSLRQTSESLTAEVAGKVDETYGSSSSSFGWSLKSTGFYVYSNSSTVLTITSNGLSVVGAIDATSGSIGNLIIDGYLRFGGDTSYYISANYNDGNYYVSLPGLRIDKASTAVFSGKLSAPSGVIGGFTISSSKLYSGKTSYSDSNSGVYLGTDGIGLGAGSFYVTSAGKLYATNADISGTITATGGTIGGFTINASSLTNSSGGSYIEITSGSYKTYLGAGNCYSTYSESGQNRGWSLSYSQFRISAYTLNKYSGIVIQPSHTKQSSHTSATGTTIAEGCITTYSTKTWNADSSYEYGTEVPFILGISRGYADAPYAPTNQWGAFLRFASWKMGELVYDSYHGGKWQLRDANNGRTYDLGGHKFYFWTYSSSVGNDSRVSITSSTHGLSSVKGAIVIPRETYSSAVSGGLSGDRNLINGVSNYGVYCSGTTVYVVCDTSSLSNGFYCLIYGS